MTSLDSNAPAADTNEFKLLALEELRRALDVGFETASERQRELLRYLVTEEIEGRGGRIKAYSIATEVLARGADFDPQQDSIVRVEIGRLRQTLERYYLTAGAGARLVIAIPKGQYRPVFQSPPPPSPIEAAPLAPAPSTPAPVSPSPQRRLRLHVAAALAFLAVFGFFSAWSYFRPDRFLAVETPPRPAKPPLVVVAPFSFSSDKADRSFVGAGLQTEFVGALAEFDWLSVAPLTEEAAKRASLDPTTLGADFVVRVAVRLFGERVAATVLLLDGKTGAVRWTRKYDLPFNANEVIEMQRDIVAKIAADVGQPFGVVARIERTRLQRDEFKSEDAFACHLRAVQYWTSFSVEDYARARACFEALRNRAPPDANSLAALALLVMDPVNVVGPARPERLADALALAKKAYEVDALAYLPRVARYTAALCHGDLDTFERIGRDGARDYPHHPVVLLDFGGKLALGAGKIDEGRALIRRARELTSNLAPIDAVAASVAALLRGETVDQTELRETTMRSGSPTAALLLLAAGAGRLEEADRARALKRLAAVGFSTQSDIMGFVAAQCWSEAARETVAKNATQELRRAAPAPQSPR